MRIILFISLILQKPFSDYRIPMPSLKNWFPAESAARKRKEIQELLLQLTRQLRPEEEAESLVKMLKPSDPPRTEVPSVVVDPTPLAGPNRVVETLVVSMETDVALVTGPESPPAAAEADTEPEESKTTEEDSTSVDWTVAPSLDAAIHHVSIMSDRRHLTFFFVSQHFPLGRVMKNFLVFFAPESGGCIRISDEGEMEIMQDASGE
jgi:hypothetical protein